MQTDNLIKTSVGVALGVVLLVTLALPIIAGATETEGSFSNGKLYYMTELDEDDTLVYTYQGGNWTFNGEDIDIDSTVASTVIAGDGYLVRANGQLRGATIATPASIESLTVTSGGLTMTYTKADSTTATVSAIGEVYYCATTEQTANVVCAYGSTNYLLKDSEILAEGLSTIATGTQTIFKITGNINDGLTVTSTLEGVTISNLVINKTAVEGYIDLYEVESITFNSTYQDEVRQIEYTSYIVPAEVTAEKAVHFDSSEIAILELIPLLLAVALVLGIIAYAIRARLS